MLRHNLAARLSILSCHFRLVHQSFALARSAESLQLLLYISILLTYRTYYLVPHEHTVLESAAAVLSGDVYCSAMGCSVHTMVAVSLSTGNSCSRCYFSTVERLKPTLYR
jgi:hypothetical protein